MTLKEELAELARLDSEYRARAASAENAKAARDTYEWHVHQRMEDEGFDVGDDIKHNGTRYGRQVDWYAVIQDEFEFNTWAEANAPHLIQPKPRKAKLNELVQEHMDDGTPLPPGIGANPKRWVSRRAA